MRRARALRAVTRTWLANLRADAQLAAFLERQDGCTFERHVVVKGPLANLELGARVQVQSGSMLHLGGFEWSAHVGRIAIGDDSVISPNCVLYGAGTGGIFIGRRFDCGPSVGIFASRTDYVTGDHIFEPVVIGDDVILFAHVVISPGVTIGEGATVAAGSVVLHDVPPNSLVAGVPARVVREHVRRPITKG